MKTLPIASETVVAAEGGFAFSFQNVAYVAAALLFILALAGLSKQESARRFSAAVCAHGVGRRLHTVGRDVVAQAFANSAAAAVVQKALEPFDPAVKGFLFMFFKNVFV